ncbi:hypothetical protein [Chitinophaga nivalis]|uniref:Uncharacterized protein n=1 Tax=Chitinophaga nivalis TaxID=2991709 RepID=A0ABT3IFH5_9BACT|nr:hypothetical protein [Chitinophaga nivalis]MCW3467647.1 hypothetical protein [Chitinophaga nivalis]MCW3482661.1 hypothetical protein [Chitinophaga nivalis]
MSKIFEINYPKLVRLLLPPRLRQPRQVAWLQALTTPVSYLFQQFRRNRNANIYRLKITPQVVYLEKLLNERYDISNRRIRITDAFSYEPWYIYQIAEDKPQFLYQPGEHKPVHLFTKDEIGQQTVDFYVTVPQHLEFNENEMRALLDNYKLAGKTYKIQTV